MIPHVRLLAGWLTGLSVVSHYSLKSQGSYTSKLPKHFLTISQIPNKNHCSFCLCQTKKIEIGPAQPDTFLFMWLQIKLFSCTQELVRAWVVKFNSSKASPMLSPSTPLSLPSLFPPLNNEKQSLQT